MTNKKLNIAFYQNVAKLFYAIAAVDKVVRAEEIKTLKRIVKEEWLAVDETEDDFNTDAAYQIEIVFDWLLSEDSNAETCYKEFVEYKNQHTHFFTDRIKNLITETAGKIAASFAGKNKSELIMLAKLSLDLKNTP